MYSGVFQIILKLISLNKMDSICPKWLRNSPLQLLEEFRWQSYEMRAIANTLEIVD